MDMLCYPCDLPVYLPPSCTCLLCPFLHVSSYSTPTSVSSSDSKCASPLLISVRCVLHLSDPQVPVKHWSQTQFLEGHSSAQIYSNPNQTHLIQLIKVFRITRNFQAGVSWGLLELNSVELRPSRNSILDHCCKAKITFITNIIYPSNCISELNTRLHNFSIYSAVLINVPVEILILSASLLPYYYIINILIIILIF